MLDESARQGAELACDKLCNDTCSLELTLLDFSAQPVGQVLAPGCGFCIRSWLKLE